MTTQNEKRMVIAVASDDNYAIPMYVMLFSLLANLDSSYFCDINILTSGDFSERNLSIINTLEQKFIKCKLVFHNMAQKYQDAPISNDYNHVTIQTYYRLNLSSLLPDEDRCLYLDVDIIVNADISALYETDLDGYYVAGVKNAWFCWPAGEGNLHKNRLCINNSDTYINAGVSLFNLKAIRADDIEKKYIELTDKQYDYMDQDILNIICFGKIKIIPLKFNFFARYARFGAETYDKTEYLPCAYSRDEFLEAIEKPIIIHYANKSKPWKKIKVEFSEIWWDYLFRCVDDKSIFYEYLCSVMNSGRKALIRYETQIKELNDSIALQECELDTLFSSHSYRIGHFITALPRKIRLILNRRIT